MTYIPGHFVITVKDELVYKLNLAIPLEAKGYTAKTPPGYCSKKGKYRFFEGKVQKTPYDVERTKQRWELYSKCYPEHNTQFEEEIAFQEKYNAGIEEEPYSYDDDPEHLRKLARVIQIRL
jgi:hypothetical protein